MQNICPFTFCTFCSFSVRRKFRPPEVPAQAPEVPAHIFHPKFLAKSFSCFSLEGFRKFAPEVSRKFPGVRKFRSLVRNIRPKENLAKSFAFSSRVGVRNFAPEVCSGNFRGTGSSGVSPGISGPGRKFRPL